MGSTESGGGGGGGGCGVDTAPGSIVWVRRRNGSWWPGKILSPTQLPSTHLMSPRSGTPVKLLGREDASVDWYNLEKSKRVKAFRCGEFDDCIEKAEASFGLPAKKREKYARREDAIIHALELEKKLLENKHGKVGALNSGRDISSGTEKRGLATPSRAVENCNEKLGSHELYQLDKKDDIPNRMENNIPPHSQTARGVTLSYLPECNNEAVHGIGGLKEFKLGTGTINKQIYAYAASDDPNKMVVDGHATAASDNDPSFENFSDSDSRNSIGKRKRLLGSLVEEPFLKRHNGHHMFPDYSLPSEGNCVSMYGKEQIVSSVQNSMYLTSGSLHPSDTNYGLQRQMDISASQLEAGDRHAPQDSRAAVSSSESSEETESDSSETQSVEHVDPGMLLSDAETHFRERPFTLDRFRRQSGHESTSSDESDGLSLDGPSPSGVGVSKWQLKGKRNLRSCIKKDRDLFAHRTYMEGKYGSPNQRDQRHDLSYYHDNDHNYDVDFIEDEFNTHTKGFGGRGYLASQALDQRQSSVGQGMMDWDDLTWGRPFRGYWEEKGGCSNSTFVSRDGQDILLDVELEVQANQQGERVPWVSLMSRLNGMAIVGHPILIESLEDGSTDILVSTSDVYGNLQHDSDRNRVQPMWRTARRTANFRVSRPHLSSTWDGDNDIDNQYFHQSGKVGANKSLGSSSLHRGNLSKKTHSPVSRSQGAKKPMRKTNSSSIQKTKALSSIGYDQKLNNQRRESSTNYLLGGVIKAVDCGPPTVACIPVKLVFSRLLEAVGRPPSGAARHGDSSQQL